MRYIEINNNVVTNILLADSEFISILSSTTGMTYIEIPDNSTVVIGDMVDDYGNIIATQSTVQIPQVITMRQALLQLLTLGLLDDVEVAIENISDANMKRAVQIEWEYAKDVERNSPTIGMLAQAVGMDDEALDNLFIEAVKL